MARIKPFFGLRPRHFKPVMLGVVEPRTGLSMGQSMELTAQKWHLTRAAQDELAYESHRKAAAAWKEGFYDDLVVPFRGLAADNNIRADTSPEKLAKLRPVFDLGAAGTLTAGNSTLLTDGASAVLLASEEWARRHALPVLACLSVLRQGLGGGFRLGRRGDCSWHRPTRSPPCSKTRRARAGGFRLLRAA